MQRLITLGLALYSFFLIKMSIPHLPARVPTHFNVWGKADGWGSPDSLWQLLLAQVLVCCIVLAVPFLARRYPGAVHIGFRNLGDFTPEQREQIMPLLADMMGNMSVLMGLFFCFLLRDIIHAASSPHPHISVWWELGLLLACAAELLVFYLRRMDKVANRPS